MANHFIFEYVVILVSKLPFETKLSHKYFFKYIMIGFKNIEKYFISNYMLFSWIHFWDLFNSTKLLITYSITVLCLVTKSCPTLCNCMDCSHLAPLSMGILQAKILQLLQQGIKRKINNNTELNWTEWSYIDSWKLKTVTGIYELLCFFGGEGWDGRKISSRTDSIDN